MPGLCREGLGTGVFVLEIPRLMGLAALLQDQVADRRQHVERHDGRDDQAAEYLRDIVRGGLALIKMQSGDPQFAALANSIRLEGSGKTVSVSFSVPADLIDLLLSQGPRGLVPVQ